MKIHNLKTWPEYFQQVWEGVKTFEVRKNDRGFEAGDKLLLLEYDPNKGEFSGRSIQCNVLFVLYGGQFGIEEGYCVLSLGRITGYLS